MSDFIVVIPARYASVRLPGKPLLELNGKPMIQHVYERAVESGAIEVVVATDHVGIAAAAESFGAVVCITGADHQSGTERIAEVVDLLDWDDSRIVVNLQGDEPLMPAATIRHCAQLLDDPLADIATLASPFLSRENFLNPNFVKVIRDNSDHAIYFSRAAIPYARESDNADLAMEAALHHHGIYAYRCGVLRQLVSEPASPPEISERLEQLRALSLGMTISVGIALTRPGVGVDVVEDLRRAEDELRAM